MERKNAVAGTDNIIFRADRDNSRLTCQIAQQCRVESAGQCKIDGSPAGMFLHDCRRNLRTVIISQHLCILIRADVEERSVTFAENERVVAEKRTGGKRRIITVQHHFRFIDPDIQSCQTLQIGTEPAGRNTPRIRREDQDIVVFLKVPFNIGNLPLRNG